MKTLRRALFYLLLTISVLLIALVSSVFLFKDRIIQQFIREANKQLSTPVKIAKIEVSVFEQFPQLSIVLHDVYVEDSHPGQYPLLTAERISFLLSPVEVWRGHYTIKGLKVSGSETNLKLNRNGENNFTIIKQQQPAGKSGVRFELSNVALTDTRVHYTDLNLNQEMSFTSRDLLATIQGEGSLYTIKAKGQLTIEKISLQQSSYFSGKSFSVDSKLLYNDTEKLLTIEPSSLQLKSASFSVNGTYRWKDGNQIHLATRGENTDIQTLLSLLPESTSKNLEKYQSKGDVYFSASLNGEISKTQSPELSVEFGFRNATIYHPDYKSRIEEASVEGSFATDDLSNRRLAALVLKNISGKLNGESFTANFIIQDFIDPEVICNFKGKVDASSVISFYPIQNLNNVTGSLLVDISFEGKIGLLKNKATAQRVSTLGTIGLLDINLEYGTERTSVQDLNGNLQFSNNDMALSNVSGKLGSSDFLLNGFFKNIVTFVLFEDQPIGIETDLKSDFVDLDQLFAISFGSGSASENEAYSFRISPNVNLNFNCDIGSLQYKRFRGKRLTGDLLVKNEMAVSRNLSVKTMGGELQLSGIVDAKNTKAIDVVVTAALKGIYVDSAFYVFENFEQDFIEDRHLKGQATADVSLEMTLNEHLKLFPETLIADIGATIKNGQLNNFDPLKKLNRYLDDDEGLSHLRFSDLKNDIHIEKKTVFIPQMEVRSNVTNITISGTHTFDQQINYRLVAPLRKKKLKDPEAQLAVEEDQKGMKLFLKITGTTNDYRIVYDTESVRKKIASDLKKEVQELKDAFKTKKKQKEVELEKDDYFDW